MLVAGAVIVGLLLAVVLPIGAKVAPAQDQTPPAASNLRDGTSDGFSGRRVEEEEQQERIREGTKLEKTGYFKSAGDGVTFYTDEGKVRFRGLENLILERIARTIEDTPGQVEWNVRGTVTEFRGNNYLLITHAILKTKADNRSRGSLPASRG